MNHETIGICLIFAAFTFGLIVNMTITLRMVLKETRAIREHLEDAETRRVTAAQYRRR